MSTSESGGLKGKQVAVIGLGASGRAAARLALQKGGEVYVSDLRIDAQAAAGGAELRALGADVETGGHDVERLARALAFPVPDSTCPRNDESRRAWLKEWLGRSGPAYRQIRTNVWRAAHRNSQS